MLPVTDYGGHLPVEAWGKADSLVAAAWEVYIDLDARVRPRITENTSYLSGILATFKKNVENFAAHTERLKHGPPLQSDTAIDDYLTWGTQFQAWAAQIDADADYGSTWGMWKSVSADILRDVAAFAVRVGTGIKEGVEGVAGLGKALPYILVGLAALYVFGKSRK